MIDRNYANLYREKVKNSEGKSAFMYAQEKGHEEIVKLLKEAGARDE
ncbi:MAG: ankyrin repeat domain-containing protein [Leptospiraceae bacterium]|nr:ankyrin repeat domain-containing protein [Leptospiraceae bacterium]MCP5493451.1 ankyrin repeat domain-containing protein [Leptospiraceae bacterium]